MDIEKIKKKMRNWTDSAGFDLSADIDSIRTEEDARGILSGHRRWLEDLANEAQQSTDQFEKELFGS